MEENRTMSEKNCIEESNFQKIANRVSLITIIGNVALSVVKLLAGIIAHSSAMISDAVHSASDVFSTFVVIIGIKLASKEPDKEHPYGHERLECVASSFRCLFFHRSIDRNRWRKAWIPCHGFHCKSGHFCVYRQSFHRHF